MLLFNSCLLLCASSSSISTLIFSPAKPVLPSNHIMMRHCFQCPLSTSSPIFTTTLRCGSTTQHHVYPDPIPEFAEFETHKFKLELFHKLSEEDVDEFGDEVDAVIDVCARIFSEFLHKEYGGPGTLLVTPFTNMLVALKKKKLPGASLAARASLLWAQNHVDEDWQLWNSKLK